MHAFLDFPDALPGATSGSAPRWRARFEKPVEVLRADTLDEVLPVLRRVQAHALAGRWCVGEVTYEAATGLDAALPAHPHRPGWPLVRFAVYTEALPWPQASESPAPHNEAHDRDQRHHRTAQTAPTWHNNTSYHQYNHQVEQARQAMARGECYQITLTHAMEGHWGGASGTDVAAWFGRLRAAQPGGYQAWLDWDDQHVLSLSPELFFDWRPDGTQGVLTCQPMKGTAPRNGDPALDAASAQALKSSDKERAENVMIVDLLRNDMGRIAVPGSVQVQELFGVLALPTVWPALWPRWGFPSCSPRCFHAVP